MPQDSICFYRVHFVTACMSINIWHVWYVLYTESTPSSKVENNKKNGLAVCCSLSAVTPNHKACWGHAEKERESECTLAEWRTQNSLKREKRHLPTYASLHICKCTWYAHGSIQTNAQKREMLYVAVFLSSVSAYNFIFHRNFCRYLHFTIWMHVQRKQQPCMVQHVWNLYDTHLCSSQHGTQWNQTLIHTVATAHCILVRNLSGVLHSLQIHTRWTYFANQNFVLPSKPTIF